jgi:hypothetical protein
MSFALLMAAVPAMVLLRAFPFLFVAKTGNSLFFGIHSN